VSPPAEHYTFDVFSLVVAPGAISFEIWRGSPFTVTLEGGVYD
jgi:hypothetical protein